VGYLIGTDEAGYGPNLGPRVGSATVWEVPEGVGSEDLGPRLTPMVVSTPGRMPDDRPCVAIGDSKVLYQPDRGLRYLEQGLWAAMAALGHRPATWREVWQRLAPESLDSQSFEPWYRDYDCELPCDADRAAVDRAVTALAAALEQAGVRLVAVRSRAVFPEAFNALVEKRASKGSALSPVTLALAAEMIAALPDAPVWVVCDKHGGRDRYHALLSEHFPDNFIEIHGEGRAASVYRFGPAERRIEFRFQMRAESCLATALASMAAKYLRELAMRAWNQFWCRRIDGLQPTAGYPHDAKRFKQAIGPLQQELGIDDRRIWRNR